MLTFKNQKLKTEIYLINNKSTLLKIIYFQTKFS